MSSIGFVGNMTSALELRFTSSGLPVGSVTVAVNRKRGEVEETDFHRVTLWRELAENAAALEKGTRVVVVGRLSSREYETREGEKRTGWEVKADAFGPDLRFATATVGRTANRGGVGGSTASSGHAGVSGDSWGAVEAPTGFGGGDDAPF